MNRVTQFFEFEQSGNVLIVVAHGPIMEFRDKDIRDAYNEAFRRLDEPDTKHLLIDFSNLDYFGSTFVGILIRLARKARSNTGVAALCCLSGDLREMLKTLMLLENPKVDFSLVPYATRTEALKALAAKNLAD